MAQKTLSWYHGHREYFMLTAHRGASYEFPENTFLAMQKAVEAGADMIEFDLRGTSDNVPVLLHDETINRTSDGSGIPEDYTLAELKKFNFSWYLQNQRRSTPVYDTMEIPTFEEILDAFRDKVCMNIQTYAKNQQTLARICALFREYDMYDRGYLTIDPDYIEAVRALDPQIEVCVTRGWETRSNPENLRLCKEENQCRFVQPIRQFTDEKAYALIRELGMRSNTFFTDNPEEMKEAKRIGAEGILTNKIHLLASFR